MLAENPAGQGVECLFLPKNIRQTYRKSMPAVILFFCIIRITTNYDAAILWIAEASRISTLPSLLTSAIRSCKSLSTALSAAYF